jgi:hypothetical protein
VEAYVASATTLLSLHQPVLDRLLAGVPGPLDHVGGGCLERASCISAEL